MLDAPYAELRRNLRKEMFATFGVNQVLVPKYCTEIAYTETTQWTLYSNHTFFPFHIR